MTYKSDGNVIVGSVLDDVGGDPLSKGVDLSQFDASSSKDNADLLNMLSEYGDGSPPQHVVDGVNDITGALRKLNDDILDIEP